MKVKFSVDWSELRNFCVKNDFYTRGTNEEYSDMFNEFNVISALETFDQMRDVLEKVSKNILDHSSKDSYIVCGGYDENVKEVMTELLENGAVSIWFD